MDLKEQVEQQATGGIEVVSLQPISIVDHVLKCHTATLKSLITDEVGGSHRVPLDEIQRILATVGEYFSKAGGSASNVVRGLAGFGVNVALIGARGADESGALFNSSMIRAGVNMDKVIIKEGSTGRCCILSTDDGQRTMRTCFDGAACLSADELNVSQFCSTYVFLSGYSLYNPGLLERAVDLALACGAKIALDLASFEIVRTFRSQLKSILDSGAVSVCFCNEDEAMEWAEGRGPEVGLDLLSRQVDVAVVTLGEKGCLVKERNSSALIAQPACSGVKVVDSTGAGDLYAAGFLYSLLRGYSLERAAEIGCLAGGAVVQALGADMGPENWQWLHARLHGARAAETVRSSAAAVQQELLACYSLIEKKGRGVVYYGSARLKEGSPHWEAAKSLASNVAGLLKTSTTWSGGGPGMMQAAALGALEAGYPVAGIRIGREAGTTVRSASYLPDNAAVICRFLSSRKVALVDAGVRMKESDRTGFIFLPGGLGTMDELFELLCLMQLRKLGTRHPVPLVLCNFKTVVSGKGCYDGLLEYLASCVEEGLVGTVELRDVVVAGNERQALAGLAAFYHLEDEDTTDNGGVIELVRASSWVERRLEQRQQQQQHTS